AESPPATLGGGRVLQPTARRLRRRDLAALDRLNRLASPDPAERTAAALSSWGVRPWTDLAVCRETGVPIVEVPAVLDHLAASGALIDLPIGPRRSVRVMAEVAADLEDRLLRALARLHAAHPRQSSIRRAHVVAALPDLASDALVAGLLARLKARGLILEDARTVALKDFEPRLSHAERRLKAELAETIQAGGLSPPDLADLTANAGPRASVLPELLTLLVDEGSIVDLGHGLFLDVDADADLRRKVTDHLADGGSITMSGLRDLLGTTRKFAVPIGEYLDRIGLTRRQGDLRVLANHSPG
ncbi:MAG: SelB C-terminal domain-containing protein, partial [Isosphaeraceae bacterium]